MPVQFASGLQVLFVFWLWLITFFVQALQSLPVLCHRRLIEHP